jgi:hypothetical protein
MEEGRISFDANKTIVEVVDIAVLVSGQELIIDGRRQKEVGGWAGG